MRNGAPLNIGLTRPRSLIGPIGAASDFPTLAAELKTGFEAFKGAHDARVTALETEVDTLAAKHTGLMINGTGAARDNQPADPEYLQSFGSWFRDGADERELKALNSTGDRQRIRASMTEGTSGGYLTPIEWDRKINAALLTLSPMRQLATVIQTTTRGYSTLWNLRGLASGWVGETASRPATAEPTLAPITFSAGEIYAMPSITQDLLEDSAIDLGAWIAGQVDDEFAKQESIAFISGDGANKPLGFLSQATGQANAAVHPGGPLDAVPSGAAAGISADAIVDMVFGLAGPYRQNASFLMNSMTLASIGKLKDGQGNYLWNRSYIALQPSTLLGYPVKIDENMPDIAAGSLPIAFGDFARGYVINDRLGTTVLRDPFSAKPYVQFYTRKRVGGGVLDPRAIRVMKIGAS